MQIRGLRGGRTAKGGKVVDEKQETDSADHFGGSSCSGWRNYPI